MRKKIKKTNYLKCLSSKDSELIAELINNFKYDANKTNEILAKYSDLGATKTLKIRK